MKPSYPRRTVLLAGAGAFGLMVCPQLARPLPKDMPEDVQASIRSLFGDRTITAGKVTVDIPGISENGHSVPLTVTVDSPMTGDDHVTGISVFAERNPLPDVARFTLGPRAGLARVETRIRMADSQRIVAVAEMSDGSLWSGHAFGIVTLAACVL